MKRLFTTELAVGLFALVGLLVIIYMSLEVNDRSTIGGDANTHPSYFDSVSGLVQKVPVEVAGIASGYVDKIELKDGRALVTVRIRRDIPVYEDASLHVRDRGILGDRFLTLNPGTPTSRLLADGEEITKTYSTSDYEKLFAAMGETAEMIRDLLKSEEPPGALGKVIINLRDTTATLRDIVGGNEERLTRILTNIEEFSADLRDITAENKDEIQSALVALNDALVSIKKSVGEGGSVDQAAEKFNRSMTSLENITQKIERGEGTIGKLVHDETTVNNLNETIEGLKDTIGLFRKVQLGVRYRGEYLTSAEKLQNLIGFSLAPAPDKFIQFELVDAPVGETKVVNTTVSSGGNVISTTETVQTNDDVLFSLLLGKRLWDLTFRFGLMRNEGGVGLDYHLWKDKFIVTFEAFDFSRNNNRAHFRTYGTLVLYKHLLLTGGVDDLITQVGGRNAFFGAGIQFTDNDLKALVTTIPGRL